MLEENIPDFLVELGRTAAASGMNFETWLMENPDGVDILAAKYL